MQSCGLKTLRNILKIENTCHVGTKHSHVDLKHSRADLKRSLPDLKQNFTDIRFHILQNSTDIETDMKRDFNDFKCRVGFKHNPLFIVLQREKQEQLRW